MHCTPDGQTKIEYSMPMDWTELAKMFLQLAHMTSDERTRSERLLTGGFCIMILN